MVRAMDLWFAGSTPSYRALRQQAGARRASVPKQYNLLPGGDAPRCREVNRRFGVALAMRHRQ